MHFIRYVDDTKGYYVEDTSTWTGEWYSVDVVRNMTKEKYIYGVHGDVISAYNMNKHAEMIMVRDKLLGINSRYKLLLGCSRMYLTHLSIENGSVYTVADGTYSIGMNDGGVCIDDEPFEFRLPKSCKRIAKRALMFSGVKNSNFNFIETVEESAFMHCNNLRTVSFDSVMEVEYEAFSGCANMRSVSMPKAEKIGADAFRRCKSLEFVYIPTVAQIGIGAFEDCPNLKKLIVSDEVAGNITKYQEQLGIGELLKSNSDLEILTK